jgi:cysteine protease ATG4
MDTTPQHQHDMGINSMDLGSYKRIVQYFWDPEPKNEEGPGSHIWCLGNEYVTQDRDDRRDENLSIFHSHPSARPSSQTPRAACDASEQLDSKTSAPGDASDHDWPSAFLDDFESKIWLTYRSNFPPIPKSADPYAPSSMTLSVRLRSQLVESHGFTSDTGWGCMIRSGQSLLANALSILSLGRGTKQCSPKVPASNLNGCTKLISTDWRRGTMAQEESKLLSLFADDPNAPFSIHRFVSYGASSCGKHPGEWFGPSATARCIQYVRLHISHKDAAYTSHRALSSECRDAGLNVYITSDSSDVYEDKFRESACGESDQIKPTLILLGIRLGIDRVTPVYWQSLEATLKQPQSVGIAGYVNPIVFPQKPMIYSRSVADVRSQWSTVSFPLFCGSPELLFLLSRSPSHPSCTAIQRSWASLYKRRAQFIPYASTQEATCSGHGSKHADRFPYQG